MSVNPNIGRGRFHPPERHAPPAAGDKRSRREGEAPEQSRRDAGLRDCGKKFVWRSGLRDPSSRARNLTRASVPPCANPMKSMATILKAARFQLPRLTDTETCYPLCPRRIVMSEQAHAPALPADAFSIRQSSSPAGWAADWPTAVFEAHIGNLTLRGKADFNRTTLCVEDY